MQDSTEANDAGCVFLNVSTGLTAELMLHTAINLSVVCRYNIVLTTQSFICSKMTKKDNLFLSPKRSVPEVGLQSGPTVLLRILAASKIIVHRVVNK